MLKKITVLALCASIANAASIGDSSKKLTHINDSIANVEAQLSQQQKLRNEKEALLRKTEITISNVFNQLHTTEKKLDKEQNYLKVVNNKVAKYQKLINEQKKNLAEQIRFAYLLPKDSFLQVLLNEKHTIDADRMRQYDYYISESQAEKIKELKKNVDILHQYQERGQEQSKILLNLKEKQQKQHNELNALQTSRKKIVAAIDSNILTKQQRLSLLNTQKRALEQTIAKLKKASHTLQNGEFEKLKGKLKWPIDGILSKKFASTLDQTDLTSNGVMIKTKEDQSVHVIANGEVVFADWLSGYGLLLIVEHGNGYMSLYGRNQNLYKQVGDKVHEGEVIARVGQSGGYKIPELYFAIRHNAKAENPASWCE